MITEQEIRERFKHHPPKNDNEILKHEYIRALFNDTAIHLMEHLPPKVVQSREFAQVLTDLENAMMHCNAAYARHKETEPRTKAGSLD